MEAVSLIRRDDPDVEATSFPPSVTADWLEDGNETTGNQFQQPDWQVGDATLPHWWNETRRHELFFLIIISTNSKKKKSNNYF